MGKRNTKVFILENNMIKELIKSSRKISIRPQRKADRGRLLTLDNRNTNRKSERSSTSSTH